MCIDFLKEVSNSVLFTSLPHYFRMPYPVMMMTKTPMTLIKPWTLTWTSESVLYRSQSCSDCSVKFTPDFKVYSWWVEETHHLYLSDCLIWMFSVFIPDLAVVMAFPMALFQVKPCHVDMCFNYLAELYRTAPEPTAANQ